VGDRKRYGESGVGCTRKLGESAFFLTHGCGVADSRKEQEALMGLLMTVRASMAKAMLSLSVDMGDQVT
jgi:hypothetical protein